MESPNDNNSTNSSNTSNSSYLQLFNFFGQRERNRQMGNRTNREQNAPKTENHYLTKRKQATSDMGSALTAALPWTTALGVAMLTFPMDKSPSLLNLLWGAIKLIGIPVTVGGIVIDIVKAPICGVIFTAKAAEAATYTIAGAFLGENPDEQQTRDILASFILRLNNTAKIIAGLGLDTAENMNEQMIAGKADYLVAMTLLHTAFDSRLVTGECLQLANGNKLKAEHCPEKGKALFTEIVKLKNALTNIVPDNETHARQMLTKWLPIIFESYKDNKSEITTLEATGMLAKWMPEIQANINDNIRGQYFTSNINQHELTLINSILRTTKKILNEAKKFQSARWQLNTDDIANVAITVRRELAVEMLQQQRETPNTEFDDFDHRIVELVAADNNNPATPIQSVQVESTDDIDNKYLDPITMDIMRDPVTASDGAVYDRVTVHKLMQRNQRGIKLRILDGFTDNNKLRAEIHAKYPEIKAEYDASMSTANSGQSSMRM